MKSDQPITSNSFIDKKLPKNLDKIIKTHQNAEKSVNEQHLETIIHSRARARVPHDFDASGKIHQLQCKYLTKQKEAAIAALALSKRQKRCNFGKTNRLDLLSQSRVEATPKKLSLAERHQLALGTTLAGAGANERILSPPSTYGNLSKLNVTQPYTAKQYIPVKDYTKCLYESLTVNTRYGNTRWGFDTSLVQADPKSTLYISESVKFKN